MIKIQNVYYMLTYAFQVLREQRYASCAFEPFENTEELLSEILIKGLSSQVKRGLGKAYLEETEFPRCPRGKIEVAESLKLQTLRRQELICTYDEFSINSYQNRIIKTTVNLLFKSDISDGRKRSLHRLMLYFKDVEPLDVKSINWHISYNRNNQTYRMLIFICWLIINGCLQNFQDGSFKIMHFDDLYMNRLYEKFLLEYYRREYPQLKASPSQIAWKLDDDFDDFLPIMQSDVMLFYESRVLIIDAKYYESHTLQTQYNVKTQHSSNLYQMFTYVKNKKAAGYKTSGLILYAKTDEEIQPNQTYRMSGNTISVKTLDLNCDFSEIKKQLNAIAEDFMKSGMT